jgi:hypothetical protein
MEITTTGIDEPTVAQIHAGAEDGIGPVIAELVLSGGSPGCTDVDTQVLEAILDQPSSYYVDVHTSAFPAGAIRGQLAHLHEDVAAPWPTAFSIAPAVADISFGDAEVTFTLGAIDDTAGITSVTATIESPSGTFETCNLLPPAKSYPLTLAGACSVVIEHGSEVGNWAAALTLTDRTGNVRTLGADALAAMGLPYGVEVFVDVSGPSLAALSVSPSSVNVFSSGAQVTAEISATDDASGVASVTVALTSPSAAGTSACTLLPPSDTYPLELSGSCTLALAQASEAGAWGISVSMLDRLGNPTELGPTDLQPAGQPWAIEVTTMPPCEDGQQSGDETDVDCGGSCDVCSDGLGCVAPEDCQSNSCDTGNTNVCLPATCGDGISNNEVLGETDVDCGGEICGTCANGLSCNLADDCTSAYCDDSLVCAACTSNAQCGPSAFCASGVCTADPSLGTPCSSTDQCASGHCVDGVCCNSECGAPCEACNLGGSAGFCTAVPSGESDGCGSGQLCDGAGSCKFMLGSTCSSPTDCLSGFCAPEGKCCNTPCDQPCKECGFGGICRNVPWSMPDFYPSQCPADTVCGGAGNCVGVKGAPCVASSDCITMWCADGVCCDLPCDGPCDACNLAGWVGQCHSVPQYSAGTCSSGLVCDGGYSCKLPNGASCATGNGSACASGNCPYGVCIP